MLDFEFNPFNSNLLATGGEDCHIKVSHIPDDGLKAAQTDFLVDLEGHERKINVLHFHPTANNILASASADLTLKSVIHIHTHTAAAAAHTNTYVKRVHCIHINLSCVVHGHDLL